MSLRHLMQTCILSVSGRIHPTVGLQHRHLKQVSYGDVSVLSRICGALCAGWEGLAVPLKGISELRCRRRC